MKIINLEQNSPDWLEWRKTGFSASEAPAVMGESKYFPKTPYQLYQVHTGQKEVTYTKAMSDGHKYEQTAVQAANKSLNANYQPVCASNGAFIASLDGYDSESEIKVLEIKTTTQGSDLWERGLEIYHWQLVHQCIVAGVEKALLWIYAKDTNTSKPLEFELDEADAARLIGAWNDYDQAVSNFEPPKLTEKDYAENDSKEWADLATEYKSLQETKAGIEDRLKEIKAELVEMANGQPTEGANIKVYPATRKGSVNYKKVPELEGVDLDQYRGKSTSYWSVR